MLEPRSQSRSGGWKWACLKNPSRVPIFPAQNASRETLPGRSWDFRSSPSSDGRQRAGKAHRDFGRSTQLLPSPPLDRSGTGSWHTEWLPCDPFLRLGSIGPRLRGERFLVDSGQLSVSGLRCVDGIYTSDDHIVEGDDVLKGLGMDDTRDEDSSGPATNENIKQSPTSTSESHVSAALIRRPS